MNESDYELFIEECVNSAQCKNDLLQEVHGIHNYARWDNDRDAGTLQFTNPGQSTALTAQITNIGSYSLKTKSWLWAWANESLAEAPREKSAELKRLFDLS
jgi:hypothetical protein